MKMTFYLFGLVSLLTITSCDSDDDGNVKADIPSVVLNAFEAEYPNATDVEWEQMVNTFEVDFDIENVDYDAIFNEEGSILKEKHEIKQSELPETVRQQITGSYPNLMIDDAEIVMIDGITYYQVELEGNPDKKVVYTDAGEEATVNYWD